MYHSVYFGDKNSYADWHLVPDSRPLIAMPSVNTSVIEVPGASSSIDLTEYLTGYPLYQNRTGNLKFHVLNDYEPWQELYSRIAKDIHGKQTTIRLEDDPNYYYSGRVVISDWTSNNDGTWSDISFDYDVDPYKYRMNDFSETYSYSGTSTVTIPNASIGDMPVVPMLRFVHAGTDPTIRFINTELSIDVTHTVPQSAPVSDIDRRQEIEFYDVVLSNLNGSNTNKFIFTGKGSAQIVFKYGKL